MILIIVLFTFTINNYFKPYSLISEHDLTTITGTLQSKPNVKKQSLRSSSQYISFTLKEYPQYRFEIDGAGYEAVDISSLDNYRQGTSIIFKIQKRDYNVKINNSVDPTYSEKHFHWTTISLYDAQINSNKIMTLDEYNFEKRSLYDSNRNCSFLIMGMALFFFLYGLNVFR